MTRKNGMPGKHLQALFLALWATILLAASPVAASEKIAYLDAEGRWRVIETWPKPTAPEMQIQSVSATIGSTPAFDITYLDIANTTGIGFDDPTHGATRRATFEAVLLYLDDILNEPGRCQIEVKESESDGSGALAWASPLYFVMNGFNDCFAFKHITTGVDPHGSAPDMYVTVDFGYSWNSGMGNPSGGEIDLYSVLLHEITHGLGFASATAPDGSSQIGSKAYTSFDDYLYTGNGNKLWNAGANFNGDASWLTGGDGGIQFRGPAATAAYAAYPPIYAPNTFQTGSSISHWNTTVSYAVMLHSIGYGTMRRNYLLVEAAALEDLGYTVTPPSYPDISVSPSSLHFGSWDVQAGASPPLALAIENLGTETLTFNPTPYTITGSNAADFYVDPAASFASLAAGTSRTIELYFNPSVTGSKTATLTLYTNDPDEPSVPIALTGTAAGIPDIHVSSDTLNFGSWDVQAGNSPAQPLTIQNLGGETLTFNATPYAITGNNAADFHVDAAASFAPLSPGNSRIINLYFNPSLTGSKTATLTLYTNDPDEPAVQITLAGTATGTPDIAVSPLTLDFGLWNIDAGSSPPQPLTIQNLGGDSLTFNSPPYTITGTDATDFYVHPGVLFLPMAPGGSRTINLYFNPAAPGNKTATLTFYTNDPDEPAVQIALLGNAVGTPDMVVAPTTLHFAPWDVAAGPSAPAPLVIRNEGAGTLIFDPTPYAIAGPDAADFYLDPAASFAPLNPETSRTIHLYFNPTLIGDKTATLTLYTDDPNFPAMPIALTGTAVGTPAITASPSALDFGPREIAAESPAPEDLTIQNTGAETLVFGDPPYAITGPHASDYHIDPAASFAPLDAGTSRTIPVYFEPAAMGSRTATLTLYSNDPLRPQTGINISGRGYDPGQETAAQSEWTLFE